MCAAVGLPCLRLVRQALGGLTLSGLQPGEWRDLTAEEVAALRGLAGADVRHPRPARPYPPARPGPARGGRAARVEVKLAVWL